MISDAQVHLWEANRPDRPWDPNAKPHLPEPMTAERMLAMMDEVGVDRAVISPLFLPGNGPAYALEVAERYPDRFKVMGWYQPNDPTMFGKLDNWLDHPGMCSARLSLMDPANLRMLEEGALEPFFSKAERLGIPVALFRQGGVTFVEPIAARHPGLKLIVDHVGMPLTFEEREPRLNELDALAKYPNVAVKLSALPRLSQERPPFTDLHPLIRRVHAAFGAGRMIWGSDHTQAMARDLCSYQEHVDIIRVGAANYLPSQDIDLILNGAFAEWLNWP